MRIKKLKKNRKKTIIIFIVLSLITILQNISFSKYRNTKSIKIATGIINYEKSDINTVALYLENDYGEFIETNDIPASGYNLNFEDGKTRCEVNKIKDNNIYISYNNGKIILDGITKKGTKCYLYFNKGSQINTTKLIANLNTINTPPDFSGIEGNGIYIWNESDFSNGSSPIKYYRGEINNNWVVFGKDGDQYIWWRIIRTNSNGSLRIIYSGLSPSTTEAPPTTGEGTTIGKKMFNPKNDDNMYVGFKYTANYVHGNGTNSTILGETNSTDKETLYGWYNTVIANNINYSKKIDLDAGFCNDRTPSSTTSDIDGKGGTGTDTTFYGANFRLKNYTPSLTCNKNDIFKTPIGLLTADEGILGGLVNENSANPKNKNSWLCSYRYYTMTPLDFRFQAGIVAINGIDGSIGWTYSNTSFYVKPVINLKENTEFLAGGEGTSTKPYIVSGT